MRDCVGLILRCFFGSLLVSLLSSFVISDVAKPNIQSRGSLGWEDGAAQLKYLVIRWTPEIETCSAQKIPLQKRLTRFQATGVGLLGNDFGQTLGYIVEN
eukprot:4027648-Ditylum_brightwellii.AAC.1